MNYQLDAQKCATVGPSVRQTIRERLEEQRRTAKEYLDGVESAIEFIDKNPSFENFHNILGKIGF